MNAYTLKCLPEMGIDVGSLGCIMLDVEGVDLTDAIDPAWEYRSDDPRLAHVSGTQTEGHVTLLYGLLSNGNTIRDAVDEVLEGWSLDQVKTDQLHVFPSPIETEPYVCIVAGQVSPQRELLDAHQRLSLLPHINTHPTYRPHVTLTYVHRDHEQDALAALRRRFKARDTYVPIAFPVTGINYGDPT